MRARSYFAKLFAIVLVNYLGASLGRLMAIPPGNVTPVWPPSGLALASLLILGSHYWPGVWLASFAFNLNFFAHNNPSLDADAFICSCAIATGSSLQAVLGAAAFRKVTGFPEGKFQPWTFFRGLALGGPLACLIGATFGAGSLCLTGMAPVEAFLNLWVTWWFGDATGVLVISGSILTAYLQARQRDQLEPDPDTRYLWHTFSFLILLMALGGTLWGWAILQARTRFSDRQHFDNLVADAAQKIDQRLQGYENLLYSAAGMVRAVPRIHRRQWSDYVKVAEIEARYPGIWGLGFIEWVRPDQLETFVREARIAAGPDFSLKRARPGQDAFIIKLIEPLSRNQAALGLDISCEQERRLAAETSRDSGQSRVTGIIRLVQDQQQAAGFLLLVPVSGREGELTVAERREHFRGWVYAPFAGATLFPDIVPTQGAELAFSVYDQGVSEANRIYSSATPPNRALSLEWSRTQVRPFGGRRWTIVYQPTADFRTSPFAGEASLLLIFGLALTSLLAALLVSLVSTRARALALAQSSTRALREGNEKLQRQNLELESASRMKSEFLANTSHEIRTPLNGVLGMTQMLLATSLDGEQREFALTVHKSAESLMAVLNDILDFSKIEAGKLEIEVIPFDLVNALEELADLMAYRAQETHLEFRVELDSNLPGWVQSDPGRLRQILLNLLTNAFKFTESGFVRLHASLLHAQENLRTVEFRVQDSGKGIAPDKLSILFEKFVQEDSSTTRNFGGTGLGLAICKSLVEMMGGQIGVESVLGQGSTFWFTMPLPLTEAPPPAVIPQAARAPLSKPFRVLLAEDNVVNQKVAVNLLEKLGGQVDVVANGREALEMSSNFRYDLILMDCQMPEMDGYEATRLIRGQKQTLPIIALTANAMKGDSQRCLEAGMDDYLTKPINRDSLHEALSRWLNSP